LLPILSL
jgi:hypothetical protein